MVRADDRELGVGSLEWIEKCLLQLGLDAVPVGPWNIVPFCSPFYGEKDGPHWIDRNPMAWRVTVRLSQAYRWPRFPFPAVEASITENDPTGGVPDYSKTDYFVFTQRPGVVIAAFPGADVETAQLQVAAMQLPHAESVEFWSQSSELTQCRIQVGNLNFPDDESRLRETVQSCVDAGALCRWSQVAPLNAS